MRFQSGCCSIPGSFRKAIGSAWLFGWKTRFWSLPSWLLWERLDTIWQDATNPQMVMIEIFVVGAGPRACPSSNAGRRPLHVRYAEPDRRCGQPRGGAPTVYALDVVCNRDFHDPEPISGDCLRCRFVRHAIPVHCGSPVRNSCGARRYARACFAASIS